MGSRWATVLVQAGKATAAALIGWLLASDVLHFEQPFLTPWVALFIVEATVYRSFLVGAQQIGAVTTAVVLTTLAQVVLPGQLLPMAVAVFTGLLIGRWHRFGSSGVWVGMTVLLLLTTGAADESMLVERLVATVLGCAIGIVVNFLVLPPVYGALERAETERLAWDIADVLDDLATALRRSDTSDPLGPRKTGRGVTELAAGQVVEAERAVAWSRESRRFNPRGRRRRVREGSDDRAAALAGLRSVCPHVEQIAEAVRTAVERVPPVDYPDAQSRDAFARLLDRLANAVRLRGGRIYSAGSFDAAVVSAEHALADLHRLVEPASGLDFAPAAGLVWMLLPARRVLLELTEPRPAAR